MGRRCGVQLAECADRRRNGLALRVDAAGPAPARATRVARQVSGAAAEAAGYALGTGRIARAPTPDRAAHGGITQRRRSDRTFHRTATRGLGARALAAGAGR